MAVQECVLYVTEACSLCDEALDLLIDSNALRGIVLTTIDVALDERLFATYGEHIPVFRYGEESLHWPFSVADVAELVERRKFD